MATDSTLSDDTTTTVTASTTLDPQIDGSVVVTFDETKTEGGSEGGGFEESDDVKYGFERSEMYKEKLTGTSMKIDRHLFLCYGSVKSWPAKIETQKEDVFLKSFFKACFERKAEIEAKGKVMVTVFEGGEGTEFEDKDILIFPDMVKYRGLTESNVSTFVEEVLVNYEKWSSGSYSTLTGSHIFVCAHASRDMRCGVCGPVLLSKLKEEIGSRGLNDQIYVSPCSHIGGHKYAGNIVVFSPDSEGKVTGHWYGYVTPDDIPAVIDDHIGQGIIIDRLWRGQMGAYDEKKKIADEPKPVDNGVTEQSNGTGLNQTAKDLKVNGTNTVMEGGGCCQGTNGVSCCRDENVKQSSTGVRQKISSFFTGKWERSDVFTSVAVIGAVASVAVAYNIYRRSR